jgi:hypothetical protein
MAYLKEDDRNVITTATGAPANLGGLDSEHDWTSHDWSWQDSFSPGQSHLATGAGYDLGTDKGQAISTIGDPMDLFGNRAKYAAEQARKTQMTGAEEAIAQQREQYQRMQNIYAPYRQAGEQAIGGLGYMITGQGEGSPFQLSQMGQYQRGLGEMALSNAYTAGGLSRSSAAQKGYGDFYADLLSEDVDRQLGERYDLVRMAQGAAGAVGAAGSAAQQNVGGIYGNLGNMMAQTEANYGQNRQAAYQNLSNIGSSLMQYSAANS